MRRQLPAAAARPPTEQLVSPAHQQQMGHATALASSRSRSCPSVCWRLHMRWQLPGTCQGTCPPAVATYLLAKPLLDASNQQRG